MRIEQPLLLRVLGSTLVAVAFTACDLRGNVGDGGCEDGLCSDGYPFDDYSTGYTSTGSGYGEASACEAPAYFDYDLWCCVCPNGDFWYPGDVCPDTTTGEDTDGWGCPEPSRFDAKVGTCVCPSGQIYDYLWACEPIPTDDECSTGEASSTSGHDPTDGGSSTSGDPWGTSSTSSGCPHC